MVFREEGHRGHAPWSSHLMRSVCGQHGPSLPMRALLAWLGPRLSGVKSRFHRPPSTLWKEFALLRDLGFRLKTCCLSTVELFHSVLFLPKLGVSRLL